MKKFFLIQFMAAATVCFAATGSASDGDLALILIIALLLLPVASAYFIHFIKNRFHSFKERRRLRKNDMEHHYTI